MVATDADEDGVAAAAPAETGDVAVGAAAAAGVAALSELSAAADVAESAGVGVLLLADSGLAVVVVADDESTWNEAGRKKLLGAVGAAVDVDDVPVAPASSADGRSMLDLMAATMGCEWELLELLASDSLVLLSSAREGSESDVRDRTRTHFRASGCV